MSVRLRRNENTLKSRKNPITAHNKSRIEIKYFRCIGDIQLSLSLSLSSTYKLTIGKAKSSRLNLHSRLATSTVSPFPSSESLPFIKQVVLITVLRRGRSTRIFRQSIVAFDAAGEKTRKNRGSLLLGDSS